MVVQVEMLSRPVAPGSGGESVGIQDGRVNSGRGTVQGDSAGKSTKVASRGGCLGTTRRDLIELAASLLLFDALVECSAAVMSTVSDQVSVAEDTKSEVR